MTNHKRIGKVIHTEWRCNVYIGVTGTRNGMTEKQKQWWHKFVYSFAEPQMLVCGCAIGADTDAAVKANEAEWRIVGHPSDNESQTSEVATMLCDILRPRKPPLDRNRDIVDGCFMLVAFPAGTAEEQRSGTWATVRYARKVKRNITICWPDGTTTN